jgi:hypothetical protein
MCGRSTAGSVCFPTLGVVTSPPTLFPSALFYIFSPPPFPIIATTETRARDDSLIRLAACYARISIRGTTSATTTTTTIATTVIVGCEEGDAATRYNNNICPFNWPPRASSGGSVCSRTTCTRRRRVLDVKNSSQQTRFGPVKTRTPKKTSDFRLKCRLDACDPSSSRRRGSRQH